MSTRMKMKSKRMEDIHHFWLWVNLIRDFLIRYSCSDNQSGLGLRTGPALAMSLDFLGRWQPGRGFV